ncbi:hypothetical protein KBA63_03705 [Candidatus Woesebacteria bacterium]|jgi:hypothetical protein|nr:hypothetical protein [Candidatus Woesebacteria bacterium]
MWVVKWLSKTDTYSAFHVIVKIDGKLYFAENFISRWQLIDFETGKVVPDGLIWIGHNEIYAAYDKQALVRPKESVYMVQVTLSNLVRKVTADLSNTANWASTYTLTELVGSQPFQYHWIRLYLSPVERSEKNFVLRDIQLVASTDEPNLEKYFVTRLRNGKVQVTWSQVQQLVLGALGAIDSRSLQREIQENANRYKVIQSHVSSDAWIVLDLGFYFFSTDRNDPFHEVEDVSILPFPAG